MVTEPLCLLPEAPQPALSEDAHRSPWTWIQANVLSFSTRATPGGPVGVGDPTRLPWSLPNVPILGPCEGFVLTGPTAPHSYVS